MKITLLHYVTLLWTFCNLVDDRLAYIGIYIGIFVLFMMIVQFTSLVFHSRTLIYDAIKDGFITDETIESALKSSIDLYKKYHNIYDYDKIPTHRK